MVGRKGKGREGNTHTGLGRSFSVDLRKPDLRFDVGVGSSGTPRVSKDALAAKTKKTYRNKVSFQRGISTWLLLLCHSKTQPHNVISQST